MRRTNVLSRQHRPLAHIPVFGKLPCHSSQPSSSSKEAWNLLQEREAGSHLAKHSPEVRPKIALIGLALALPGDAPGLAGNPAEDEVNEASPGSPVKGLEVIPDWRIADDSVSHSGLQEALAVSVILHVAHRSSAEGSPDCTADSAAGTYIQGIQCASFSLSLSPVYRFEGVLLRTICWMALFSPTTTTLSCARVSAVYRRFL